jgi:hypothetical protein
MAQVHAAQANGRDLKRAKLSLLHGFLSQKTLILNYLHKRQATLQKLCASRYTESEKWEGL